SRFRWNHPLANEFRRGRRHTISISPPGGSRTEWREYSLTLQAVHTFADFLAPGERHARDTPPDSRGAHLRRQRVHLRNRPRRAAVSIWGATLAARPIR